MIFTSDNGAGLRNAKAKPDERFPGRSMAGTNTPLRGGKGSNFEGGVRVPCIAWWPKTLASGRVDATPWSALDFLPTFANVAGASVSTDLTLDGHDATDLLKGKPTEPRLLLHYFGVQLQAVREGPWKLFVPVTKLPETRVPSLWFEHQPGLFEKQHRLWPKPTLYHLSDDLGESHDVASDHPDVANAMLQKATAFDSAFQKQIPAVKYLPGPKPPAPRQVRTASDNLDEWLSLSR